MRDKDIKNIINKASEGEEFSVSSEDIRNALMERIGKRGNMQANEGAGEGEIVEPIIVTARKEKKYSFVKIMAGVAAACLGIGIIGAAAYNGGFGGFYTDQLPTYDPGSASDSISDITSDNISDIDPASSTENNAFPPQTESAENTDTPNTVAPVFAELQDTVQGNFIHEAIKGGPDQYEITLLDGTVVEVKNLDETYFSEGDNDLMPISKVWDKMYFTAYGNKIDITDKMSADEYFCVSYTHPYTGLTHYLIAGGDLKAKYFGYIELFCLPSDNMRAYTVSRFFTEGLNDYGTGTFDPSNIPNRDWLDNTLKKITDILKENYGIDILVEGSGRFSDYPKFPDTIYK